MQSKLLNAHPDARLRVYAIWVNKLFGDARNRWDAAGLTDPRVVHLWDTDDVSAPTRPGPAAPAPCVAPAARSTTRSTTSARRSIRSWQPPELPHPT